ncbi:alpha/beta fold hydrolase [Fusibacter paucivorans]|uniref:Alpha/beta fold hydrolase n=1 Tax=Fusibacter paucivorans TaxID=76009 RepID=A0ABS5PLL3_9FIRM|nr:alpha/beta hydrolase [Fusibacter paucivorans]MBS7525289.1 alpha/beta fold hydrolase [Fusibacter paucivorans]
MKDRPEIAKSVQTGTFMTNYHDVGEGFPILMLHGSGPGVSAWANWQKLFPILSSAHRILAPDLVGFGYTDRPEGMVFNLDAWIKQSVDFLDTLDVAQVDIVGNSFGGAIALALAIKYPNRVRKLVLMGSMGVTFPLSYGLDRVWGYTPSIENMQELIGIFAYSRDLMPVELAQGRYEGSIQPGFQESFSSMFPAPRQAGVEAMAQYEIYLREVRHQTLIVHGREDRVIPLETSMKLIEMIENAQLHVFGKCGHWTQIERTEEFAALVHNFLMMEQPVFKR